MALPIAAAAASGTTAALAAAVARISATLSQNSTVLSSLAVRLGLRSPSANKVINVIKSNKLMTALALYELYGAADETLQQLAAMDAEIMELVETFGFKPDSVEKTESVLDINKFSDEFKLIADVVSMDGGYLNFLKRRQAYALPMDVIKLYATIASMSRTLPM